MPHKDIPENKHIQSIIFKKDKWIPKTSKKWLLDHHLYPLKPQPEITENFYIYRILEPTQFKKYFTKKLDKYPGIELIIGLKNPKK